MSAAGAARDADLQVDVPSFGQLCVGIARGFAGAMLFSLPMIMTMEMCGLGFYIDPYRLALLQVVMVPLLVRLSR